MYHMGTHLTKQDQSCTLAFTLCRLVKNNWIIEGVFTLIGLKLGIFNWEGAPLLECVVK